MLAWIAAVAVDFLMNAGVFASYFATDNEFLLPRSEAFLRIPAGYASLFLLTLILAWLIYRGKESRAVEGLRVGFIFGIGTSLVLALGMWSITTAPSTFLAVWLIDQTLEMTAAGTIIASGRSNFSRRMVTLVVVGAVSCFIVGVALQNLAA